MLLMMPTPAQNQPAPRRFLPGSSTQALSTQRKFNTPAAGPSVGGFSKRTSVSSSTPFVRTPPARRLHDEIETGFEEHSSSSPGLPTRLRYSSSLSRHRDAIDDASDDDEVGATGKAPNPAHGGEDDLADLLYLEKWRDAKALERSEREHPLESVPRKRQRISSDTDAALDDVIAISSSPSPESHLSGHIFDDEDCHGSSSHFDPLEAAEAPVVETDEEFTSSPTGPASAVVSSKFRKSASAAFSGPTTVMRPSFKAPQVQNAATGDPPALSSLPDAFSPSRRRGKRDYLPGGAADTVRSWILALAADESNAGQTYTERIKVVETTGDRYEGRFELVKDEDGRRWVLINEATKGFSMGNDPTPRRVVVGSSVGIRAGSSTVNLQLDTGSGNETGTTAEEWLVAILWDILE